MGHEGRFSRWAEEGAFELSFDVGGVGADLRVLAGEDLSQLSQFHPLGPVLGGRPLWKRLVPQRGALGPASGDYGGPLPHLFLVKWKLGTWAQLL